MILQRPLTLRAAVVEAASVRERRRGTAGLFTLGLGLVFGGVLALQLVNERSIWRDGTLAASADASERSSRYAAIVHHVELDVRYVAGDGLRGGPDGPVSFWSLFSIAEPAHQLAVRWKGTQFVTSRQIDAAGSRWWSLFALQLIAALVAWPFFAAARRARADLALLQRVAASPHEIELQIVSVGEPWFEDFLPAVIPFRWTRYDVRLPVGDDARNGAHYRDPARVLRFRERAFTFRRGQHAPLIVDAPPGRLVALRDPLDAERLVFVRHDHWPFQS